MEPELDIWLALGVVAVGILLLFAVCNCVEGPTQEGFKGGQEETELEDSEIYDEFFSKIYDKLFVVKERVQFEQQSMQEHALAEWPMTETNVLDVGCGVGHHARFFLDKGVGYIGLDKSTAMVQKARSNHPDAKFVRGDAMEATLFASRTFSHVLCMYFTFYAFQNQKRLLHNIYSWLKPSGILVLHLVNPDKFDPVLDAASPFPGFSIQKYSKDRVTESEVEFDKFKYRAKFKHSPGDPEVVFEETFTFPDDTTRHHRHNLHMPSLETVLDTAKGVGFTVKHKEDMTPVEHEYQYLVYLQK